MKMIIISGGLALRERILNETRPSFLTDLRDHHWHLHFASTVSHARSSTPETRLHLTAASLHWHLVRVWVQSSPDLWKHLSNRRWWKSCMSKTSRCIITPDESTFRKPSTPRSSPRFLMNIPRRLIFLMGPTVYSLTCKSTSYLTPFQPLVAI